jgi:hypothetical protein
MQMVAAGKPDHHAALSLEPEAQGAPADGKLLDIAAEPWVIAVALPATLAATLDLFPGIEDQVEPGTRAANAFDSLRGDETVQVFERAHLFALMAPHPQPVVTALARSSRLGGAAHVVVTL